ncbi:hypothetical protein [Streptomyces sp. PR69]|uniref:hypothetical protein n=1 Tax=Streptomyces sp. PR69 TaxID=2984950 RepID=UPI0022641B1D|nr:hypothetical protein [Streptomyces sp. PR69]
MQKENEEEETVDGNGLSAEEAGELSRLLGDLMGLMVSVKVEAETPVAGAAVRLAERIRAGLDQPDCRIQGENDGADAVLGPVNGDADNPGAVLRTAMAALGGDWGDVTVTTNIAGPVHHVIRGTGQSPDETGVACVHLWAASAWALIRYAEEHS